ncbi:MAG TPA: hypothetical protein VMR99_01400 [Candidatus Paceibacterota bacterium]|nr:hypothetical protein [Candidatus Paceibacterota bacterium]
MKLQTRKRIFYAFFLLFLVIGAAVILYAEGWRINLSTLEAEKAGGIYVRSFPDNAQITLNGKSIPNQSEFLSRGTFISGLFPKTYTLQLAAVGYDAWTESAAVVPSLVTEMKYAVLVPKAAISVATSGAVSDFFEVGGNVVATDPSGTITLLGKTVGYGTIVSHSADLKTTIIRSVSASTGATIYSFYDFTDATSTNLSAILRQAGIGVTPTTNLFVDPYDDTGIIVQTSAKIVELDSGTRRVTAIETAPTGEAIESPIAVSSSVMAWANYTIKSGPAGTSQIMIYDKFSGDMIDDSLTVPGPVKQLAWLSNNVLGILESNNTLYLYNVPNEQLSTLADDVKEFYPTTDGSALAALEYHSLEIFSFTTQDYYRFDLPQAADVQGLIWYKDETHLFVQYPDHVAFLDFADTNLKNLTTIATGTDASYDPQENSLYLIDPAQKLLRFDFPN